MKPITAYTFLRHLARTALTAIGLSAFIHPAHAQETVCARVKIEIKQELTLERQAFDAEMKISNALPDAPLTEVSVQVRVMDEAGASVRVTSNPEDLSAQFFVRVSGQQNLAGSVDGSGVVGANATAQINWLIIPAAGAAGAHPLGKKFLVGAVLTYKFGTETHTLEVAPDVITVKPLPRLTLDYFLPQDVLADDPLTDTIEPVIPFTLGVRVKNAGIAPARNLKIDSAQPRIVENVQGLLIGFQLTGSYVDDAAVTPTLKLDFGQIDGGRSRMGRWRMQTTLAGRFSDFSATYTHADELGGLVTSLIDGVHTHTLLGDVRVDLPGRDFVRDFLAQDVDALRVYESDSTETVVQDLSAAARVSAVPDAEGRALYRFELPPTTGFVYARMRDPFNGTRVLGPVLRDDAKPIAPENVWLSKVRNPETKTYEYWVNLFDANTPGGYGTEFKAPTGAALPPVLQFIADRSVREGELVSFLVEATSPSGLPLSLSAAPLPLGATFTRDAGSTSALERWVFDWTPGTGQAGRYPVQFTATQTSATEGSQSAHQQAVITVTSVTPPDTPQVPLIEAPAIDTQVRSATPQLSAKVPTPDDPASVFHFEIYADAELTALVQANSVSRTVDSGAWTLTVALNDNTRYYWRVRAQGVNTRGEKTYSAWSYGRFMVNLANDAPRAIVVASPSDLGTVRSLTPTLSVINTQDPDGDALTYSFELWSDNALTLRVARSEPIAAMATGSTAWTVPVALNEGHTYWWRALAHDPEGAQSESAIVRFTVNTGNRAPSAPILVTPLPGSVVPALAVPLGVTGSGDPDGDALRYEFQLDTTATFSAAQTSELLPARDGAHTTWTASDLLDNTRYHWRARALDPQGAASDWTQGEFFVNTANDAPSAAVPANPGLGSTIHTVQPRLQTAPATDADLDLLNYEFELFGSAALTDLLLAGSASVPELLVPLGILQEGKTYHWRVRARDSAGLTGPWSLVMNFSVQLRALPPRITLTAPAVILEARDSTPLQWEAIDPQADATIALYYSPHSDPVQRVLIVDGLRVNPNNATGTYVWSLAGLSPGTYLVHAVITNGVGSYSHQAPGAIVIPVSAPAARIEVSAAQPLITTEAGGSAQFSVVLGSAPTADVRVGLTSSQPLEGQVSPATLIFTPANWNTPQTVTVTGQGDCLPDGDQPYSIVLGRAESLDARYHQLEGQTLSAINRDEGIRDCPSPHNGSTFKPNGSHEGLEARSGLPGRIAGRPGAEFSGHQGWEWALGSDTRSNNGERHVSGELNWVSGRTLNWKLSLDGAGGGRIQVFHQGVLVLDRRYSGTGSHILRLGNAVRIGAQTHPRIGTGNRVEVSVDRINGHPVEGRIQATGSRREDEQNLYYTSPAFEKNLTLEGTVRFTFPGPVPPPLTRMRFMVHVGQVTDKK